jgi:hypothetical protein
MAENGRMKDKRYKPSHRSSRLTTEDALHHHLLLIVMTFLLMD